LDFGILLINK